MYYSVAEVSKRLKISKVTLYKKINKINELKNHVKQLKDGKYISEQGIEIIKNSLVFNTSDDVLQEQLKEGAEKADQQADLTIYKHLIETLERDKENLYKQLEIKDKQIEIKDKQIETLATINQNFQVLLKQNTLIDEPKANNKGLFWRLFGR